MKIFSGLSVADVTRAWGDIIYLSDMTDIRELNVFINSPGGNAFSGLALANMLEMARGLGFRVIAHASGIVASAAVPVLAVCDQREAAKDTVFMVHEAALCTTGVRERRALSQKGFALLNGLPWLASDTTIHYLLNDQTIQQATSTLGFQGHKNGATVQRHHQPTV